VSGVRGHENVRNLDLIVKVGSSTAEHVSVEDVREAVSVRVPCELVVRRSPFGLPNHTPLGERGWVYLERFLSMIKVAMVDETEAQRVVFSNSQQVLEEILEGGMQLRIAAQGGDECLQDTLQRFLKILGTKTFGGASSDKLMNKDLGQSFVKGSGNFDGDRAIVAAIMQDMVRELPSHWAEESTRQRQRQLELAVNRGDATACAQLLRAGAQVNQKRNGTATALHVAAKHLDLAVVNVLLEFDADCSAQDMYGDTPAHWVPLFDKEETLQLFDLLTPSLTVLSTENVASISPFERYSTWAKVAQDNQPYPPAQKQVEKLLLRFPSLSPEETEKKKSAVRAAKRSLLSEPSEVLVQKTQRCSARGRDVALSVWEPREVEVEVTVLWTFATGLHGPWLLYEPAFDLLARHLCDSQQMRLVVLPLHQSVKLSSLASWSAFCEEVAAVIEELPLPRKFVLVQEGPTTSLCWRLQHRLCGYLTLAFCAVFEEDYFSSQGFRAWAGFVDMVVTWIEAQDAHSIATKFMRNVTANITPELVVSYEAACAAYSPEEWEFWAFVMRCANSGQYTFEVQDRQPIDPLVPGVVAIPGKGAKAITQNSSVLLYNLMNSNLGGCELAFLPESSAAWALEGEATQVDVTLLLMNFLLRATNPRTVVRDLR